MIITDKNFDFCFYYILQFYKFFCIIIYKCSQIRILLCPSDNNGQ